MASLFERFDMDKVNVIIEPDNKKRKVIYGILDRYTENKLSLNNPLFKSKNFIHRVELLCEKCNEEKSYILDKRKLQNDETNGIYKYVFSCVKCSNNIIFNPNDKNDENQEVSKISSQMRKNIIVVGNCIKHMIKPITNITNDELNLIEANMNVEELQNYLNDLIIYKFNNPNGRINKFNLGKHIENYFLNMLESSNYGNELNKLLV